MAAEKAEGTIRTEGESRLDYHIRMTREALSLSNIPVAHPKKEAAWGSASLEFGGHTNMPILRRYMWLVAKLMTLYLVKGLRWAVRQTKNWPRRRGD